MKGELTERQRQVLDFIVSSIRTEGYPPTVTEIMRHFDFASPQSVTNYFATLEHKGYLRRVDGTARGIKLAEGVMPSEGSLPIVGRCAAGMPLYSEENIIGRFSMTEEFGSDKESFMLRVEGDSMKDLGIFDGDFVVVKRQPTVEQGELGVAVTEEGVAVKRIYDEGVRFRLQSANEEVQPLYVSRDDTSFRVAGKVIGVIRKLRKL